MDTIGLLDGTYVVVILVPAWLIFVRALKLSAKIAAMGICVILLPCALCGLPTLFYSLLVESPVGYAYEGDVDGIRRSLAIGANPNARDDFGTTPLCAALANDHVEAAKYLIEHGANPNTPCENQTLPAQNPLDIAAQRHEREFVAFLKAHGAVRYKADH